MGARGSRLLQPSRAFLHDLVQAAKEPFEVIRHDLAVLSGQVVHPFVNRAQRTGAALLVEVAAEALVAVR